MLYVTPSFFLPVYHNKPSSSRP